MIKKFNEHNNYTDLLLEKIINESVLYFSEVLRDRLVNLSGSSEIAAKLLELEGTDVHSDVTFVDLSKEVGLLTFMPMDKAIAKLKAVHPNGTDTDIQKYPDIKTNDIVYRRDTSDGRYGVYGDNRNSIKIGKFVNKVFRGTLTNYDVEEFVNQFKSKQEVDPVVELVSGDKIAYWYDITNYNPGYGGTLRNSCMANVPSGFFDIYTKNPEVCRLATLKNGDKLVARALVWKVESDNSSIKYYMDRIYYTKDHYRNILKDYAKEQGWGIYDSFEVIDFNGKLISPTMRVKIKNIKYNQFPYMDTFRRYDYVKGYLYNDASSSKRGDLLWSTQGEARRNQRTKIQRFKDYLGID
jgi:hypothetical protein